MAIFELIDTASRRPWRAPPPTHQLALRGFDVPLDRWEVIVIGPMSSARVAVAYHTQRLELVAYEHEVEGEPWVIAQVTVQIADRAWCYGTAYDQPLDAEGWAFGPEDADPGGALHEIARAIAYQISPGISPPAVLASFFIDVAERSAQLADPRALAAARAFHPSNRLRVHALVASDPTGRLAQLAAIAPGVVSVMACGTVRPAVARAIAGAKLADVVQELIECHWRLPAHITALGRAQRQWLLRAPAGVSSQIVDRMVPWHFVVDDVPEDPVPRVKHYEVMAQLDDAAPNLPDDALLRGVTRFVSKHSLTIHARDDWRGRLVSLLRRVNRTQHGPTRRAPFEMWLPKQAPQRDPAFLIERFERDTSSVVRLNTRAALVREGKEMRHCGASLIDEVEAGTLALYAVDDTVHRATLALRWDAQAGYWEVSEMHGLGNASPSTHLQALVTAFVRAHHGYVIGGLSG